MLYVLGTVGQTGVYTFMRLLRRFFTCLVDLASVLLCLGPCISIVYFANCYLKFRVKHFEYCIKRWLHQLYPLHRQHISFNIRCGHSTVLTPNGNWNLDLHLVPV